MSSSEETAETWRGCWRFWSARSRSRTRSSSQLSPKRSLQLWPTLRQLQRFAQQHPLLHINLLDAEDPAAFVERILAWVRAQPEDQPLAIATSDDVAEVEKNQAMLGRGGAAALADHIIGEVARGLLGMGFRKFVVAGGETSGQVINSLDIASVEVSAFDELGGGYCHQSTPEPVSLVLKAGGGHIFQKPKSRSPCQKP